MFTNGEQLRVVLAIGNLLARRLLVREDDPELAALRFDGRGYRYHSRFWSLMGVVDVVEVAGPGGRVRLPGDEADRARRRVAQEWITAGAPAAWARMEAESSVMLLSVCTDTAARA